METPQSDSGTENLIIKISQTRRRNCIRGSSGNSVCFYCSPHPEGLSLCVNTNIANAFATLYVLIRRWKTRKKLSWKKNNTHTEFFTGHCDYTVYFFFISISLSVFFTLNFSKRRACVKNTYLSTWAFVLEE